MWDASETIPLRDNPLPISPRIQAVIDAAREYKKYCGTFTSPQGQALESALAALDKEPTKDDEWPWAKETMLMINKLTPDIKGKAFDPDWFVLRQRLEAMEQRLTPAEAQARMEVRPQKVEGDEWYLAWVRDNGGEELSDQQRKVIQHYIKWHATKAKGGVV